MHVDKLIIEKLKNRNSGSNHFDIIFDFMEKSKIKFKDNRLYDVYAIATPDIIFLDIDKMMSDYTDMMISFIILHEMGHYKRIQKIGKANMLKYLSSNNFNFLHKYLVNEEMLADRYASSLYYKLIGDLFPRNLTQQLDKLYKQEQYRIAAQHLFGLIQNDEEKYNKLLNTFIR